MICFAKPVLTEDLYIVQKKDVSIICYMCEMCTLKNAYSYEKNTFCQRGCYIRTMIARFQLQKELLVVSLKGLGGMTK
jgi:hypothetical protein